MKKQILLLGLIIGIMIAGAPKTLFAEVDADINGNIQTDNRLRLDNQEFSRNDVRLMLKLEGSPGDYHYYTETLLKGLRDPENNENFQWDIDLREAYFDLYEFLSGDLDVRIGKQIIVWGTADKLNPTSNICPDDLEDTFNFGEKLGVNALNATYYLGDMSISGIFVPTFTPAALPTSGDLSSAFAGGMQPPQGMTFRTITQTKIFPEETLEESPQYGVKLSTMLFDYDVSLSYYYGRSGLPVPNKTTLTPVDAQGTVDVETQLIYPKIQVIGADFAGAIGSVGLWGEGAVFLPEKVEMPTDLQTPAGLQQQGTSITLDDEAYVKFVFGMDYTFEGGWFINMQFLHGFFHERGKDNLNDYVVGRIEKSFLNDELKVVPFGIALAITDWDDIGNNYGLAGMPEITYYPTDNVELTLGVIFLEGKGDNMFSGIKDNDEIYFKAKVSF